MSGSNHSWRFTKEKIGTRLKLIAPMVFRRTAPVDPFRMTPLQGAILDPPIVADTTVWQDVEPGSYWGRPDLNFVVQSGFTIPRDWNPSRLALHLPLGLLGDIFNHPEAMVHIDGVPVGSADRYHHTLPLDPALADGQPHLLALHGWTGHAGWPPDPASKAKLQMGHCRVAETDPGTKDFVALAGVAHDCLSVLDPASETYDRVLTALDAAFSQLDTRDPLGDEFYGSVPAALDALTTGLAKAGPPLDRTLHAVGHAHMDIAYLWPISQIRLKNQRTYSNVLRLMEAHEGYHFSHSQPALYDMTAADHPALFERIKARVAQGRWEVMGGMWVEPDLNLPGGEALIRQLVLGRTYFRDTFGDVETPVLWLPDTFGFPGQTPQLMKLAGLDWFVTNKLNWNQVNRVPWPTHIWEGIDGSRVKAHILTTPRDVQYLPFPTNYKSDLTAREVMGTVTHAGEDAADQLPICFGYGDGGGGPTDDLLARASAFEAFPGMPRLRLSTVREALAALEGTVADAPVWSGEHYLEGHRGVYTSQGWIKRANRRAERALHEAEALSAIAGLNPDLTEAWQLLCLNQFHDIITGTSIGEVFDDARRDYARIAELTEAAAKAAATRLAPKTDCIASMMPVSGPRTLLVDGAIDLPGQLTEEGKLLFFPDLAPYSITPLSQASLPQHPVTVFEDGNRITLENARLSARFEQGVLVSLIERSTGRQIIDSGLAGNTLLAFEDRPICWDAWDIDPHYEDHEEPLGPPVSVTVLETGPVRAVLRLTYHWRRSRIEQDVTLSADSYRLDFRTVADWRETHILLKAAFPLALSAPQATYDIQWGTIDRATDRDSAFTAARFEVPAHKWAEISDGDLSVALMNDCKYGYDVRPNVLRLTLIKSATAPDPEADQGHHEFTYSLFVNPGCDIARRNHAAYDLNTSIRQITAQGVGGVRPLPAFVRCDNPNVIVETIKPAANGTGIVLRLFETTGLNTTAFLDLPSESTQAHIADIFEHPATEIPITAGRVTLEMGRFEIQTLHLRK